MRRYVCVHGHFYQPPRENPWLGEIERQESAHPHHDWNERITAECYAPNAASRFDGSTTRTVNNYMKISFNFGPTLLSWMEEKAPDIYRAILEADRESQTTYAGHGSALAQVYNHMILPLANAKDKHCQIAWGIRDFEHRFGRKPEGMWLPETAADLESLEILAGLGIRFTILGPHQARHVRPRDGESWTDMSEESLDTTMAYEQRLPSGKSIALFFFDGPLSRAVAFERLLESGETFVQRILSCFSDEPGRSQLVHLATDGETFGHHHRHGETALSFALDHIESRKLATLINYGAFLEKHPPSHFVEIHENTSWSCAHGVERWCGDCGCSTGSHPGWNQAWRAPLREALDWLRDRLAPLYEESSARLLEDPWEARNDYIGVILDGSSESRERFLSRHAARPLAEVERERVWKVLELERHAMLMYTSCGWFFDDLAGIETLQVIRYAGRAIQLARELFNKDLEPEFLDSIGKARSNRPERVSGRDIYLESVTPWTSGSPPSP